MMIPAFRADGTLPEGIHSAQDWGEVKRVFGRSARRRELLARMHPGLQNLAAAGCPRVLLDGSFVTTKREPGDVDGCWEWTPQVDLAVLDASFLLRSLKDRVALQADYGLDFFLAGAIESGTGQPFSEFFQRDRDGNRKGIVRLDLDRL